MRQQLAEQQQMEMAMDFYLARGQRSFAQLQHRLNQQHPELRRARQHNLLSEQQRRLQAALQQQLQKNSLRFEQLSQRLQRRQPQTQIYQANQELGQLRYRLQQAISQQLNDNRQHFGTLAVQLETASPLATLARGFSVTTKANGDVIKNTRQLQRGDTLRTRLNDGWVESEVTLTRPASATKKRPKASPDPAAQ